ncbi:polysaccharide deacetylase family protein [Kribbella solani]|uniref:Peptidoglycan/xylan/chitin deacetylase (PgdA/CDA1 family) n=1 Tax=Kribbella solani TaxID=236067 RepID=A0A841DYI5_9ACTN|nr:polysaccharide deacetylase family protein [Kribbella solani]MBB5981830.1 peptidoglycan/xylan/chitin deacetylase (PgdA/CDA1 family) [Kribbella solani]MDX2969106.1 polysaccharide deacetylase family protein [Kribbella solani]
MAVERRTVLRSALLAIGTGTVAACSNDNQAKNAPPDAASQPTTAPASTRPAAKRPAGPRPAPPTEATEIGHGPRTVPKVALTFHGNGDPALGTELLDLVEKAGAKVSVLAVGTWLVAHPEMATRVLKGGHDLGNHTMHHKPMRKLGAADARREIGDCAAVLRRATNSQGRWFRASGTQQTTPLIRSSAAAAGYAACVSYDVDGLDWQDPPAATVVKAVLDGVHPGSIVSLHLGHQVTVKALPQILSGLSAKHLTPVTLSELLQ